MVTTFQSAERGSYTKSHKTNDTAQLDQGNEYFKKGS